MEKYNKNECENYDSFYLVFILMDLLSSNIHYELYDNLSEILNNPDDIGSILSEYISYFINNGGITNFQFSENIMNSANPIFILKITEDVLENNNKKMDVKNILKKTLSKIMAGKKFKIRGYSEKITTNAIEKISYDKEYIGHKNKNTTPFICINSMLVGLVCNKSKDVELLIKNSVKIGKLTHYNSIGLLSAIASAYFVSLAVQGVQVEKWIDMLLEIINLDMVKKYLDLDENENMIGYVEFLNRWNKYRDSRFVEKKIKKTKSDENLISRMKFYKRFTNDLYTMIGEDSINCLIVAYESLLFCDGNFEKLVYYSLLIPGTVIYIGGYVGGLYGLVYGHQNIPQNMIQKLDDHEGWIRLGKKMRKKFC